MNTMIRVPWREQPPDWRTDTAAEKTAQRSKTTGAARATYVQPSDSSVESKNPKRDASPAPARERLHAEGRDREAKRRDLREAPGEGVGGVPLPAVDA